MFFLFQSANIFSQENRLNENGKLSAVGIYKEEKNTESKFETKNCIKPVLNLKKVGKIASKIKFKNGKNEGMVYWYYEDGSLVGKSFYKKRKKEGEWISYKEDGTIDQKAIKKQFLKMAIQQIKNSLWKITKRILRKK